MRPSLKGTIHVYTPERRREEPPVDTRDSSLLTLCPLIANRPTDCKQTDTVVILLQVFPLERIVASGSIHWTASVASIPPLHHRPVELVILAALN